MLNYQTVIPDIILPNAFGNLIKTSVAIQSPILNSNKFTPIPRNLYQ